MVDPLKFFSQFSAFVVERQDIFLLCLLPLAQIFELLGQFGDFTFERGELRLCIRQLLLFGALELRYLA